MGAARETADWTRSLSPVIPSQHSSACAEKLDAGRVPALPGVIRLARGAQWVWTTRARLTSEVLDLNVRCKSRRARRKIPSEILKL